jgi:hypothetical protein
LIVQDKDGLVLNAVEWDGDVAKWQSPEGTTAILEDKGDPGDTWDGTKIIKAPAPPDPFQQRTAFIATLDRMLADILVVGQMRELVQALRDLHTSGEI